jgi:excisionase family DNA binding protein
MTEQYLRVHEVAARVRKDVSSIRRALAKGELGFRRCGRIILIPESELFRILGEYCPPLRHGHEARKSQE